MPRAVEVHRIIDVPPPSDEPETALVQPYARGAGGQAMLHASASPSGSETRKWFGATGACSSSIIELEHAPAPRALDPRLVLLSEPGSERARSYRLLRHRLFCHSDPRIVAVTSASPGEGKTTCALNLALAMAEDTMARVLLLEANLRRPALGAVFDFVPSWSFADKMTQFRNLGPPYPVASIPGTRLHIAALPATVLEGARLDRTLFAVALSDLRTAYDYVVIDAASVFESGDADVAGECSNGVVVTVRAGYSRKGETRRAISQLAPALVLGSVLIDA